MKKLLLAFLLIHCSAVRAEVYEAHFVDSNTRTKYIEVSVDGLKRLFAFDTGCSSLSLNTRLLNELVKAGKVRLADLANEHSAQMANGYSHMVKELVISELTLGNYTFHNVVAHVGMKDAADAPLLLGQSILERLRWYQISGNTLRFEPCEDDYQQALTIADFYFNDTTHQQQIADLLLPYEKQGRLSCYFRHCLFYALYHIDAYDEAVTLLARIRESDCQKESDLGEYELQLHYNRAIDLYNADRYAEAKDVLDRAWSIANSDARFMQYIRPAGEVYWHIYHQLGDDQAAKRYEKYKKK